MDYRIYCLDSAGHIWKPPYVVNALDDNEAIRIAKDISEPYTKEIWCGDKCVQTIVHN